MGIARAMTISVVLACALPAVAGCNQDPPAEAKTLRFRNVPLVVSVPPSWSQTLNSAQWLMYRPKDDGALVAMSGDKDCSAVERRVFGALLEVGLSEVTWEGPPVQTKINGLEAIVAEGAAVDGTKPARVKYSLVRAERQRGCLLTLAAVWETRQDALGQAANSILESVRAEE
jgi:hypothetical protein